MSGGRSQITCSDTLRSETYDGQETGDGNRSQQNAAGDPQGDPSVSGVSLVERKVC